MQHVEIGAIVAGQGNAGAQYPNAVFGRTADNEYVFEAIHDFLLFV
jgi:hypothetical protein